MNKNLKKRKLKLNSFLQIYRCFLIWRLKQSGESTLAKKHGKKSTSIRKVNVRYNHFKMMPENLFRKTKQ